MSFINKSANYSQTFLLKSQLSNVLKVYNQHITTLNNNNADFYIDSTYSIVPNNNIKYYLYVTNKNKLENCRENYNILYFFPDKYTVDYFEHNKALSFSLTDFFLEIDNKFQDSYLFEGYLYKYDDNMHFLVTDILAKNDAIITCDFALRYAILNELFLDTKGLQKLNNHMSIGLHHTVSSECEHLVAILKNNFVFSNQINFVEKIHHHNFKKERSVPTPQTQTISSPTQILRMLIKNGQYTDVYNVFDPETGNSKGILYVKGLKESKYLKRITKSKHLNENVYLQCKYNMTFSKWEPIIEDNHA